MLPPAEAEKLFRISRDLFSEPGLADCADELTAEACRLADKQMATITAIRFLAARSHKEAQGLSCRARVSLCQASAP